MMHANKSLLCTRCNYSHFFIYLQFCSKSRLQLGPARVRDLKRSHMTPKGLHRLANELKASSYGKRRRARKRKKRGEPPPIRGRASSKCNGSVHTVVPSLCTNSLLPILYSTSKTQCCIDTSSLPSSCVDQLYSEYSHRCKTLKLKTTVHSEKLE